MILEALADGGPAVTRGAAERLAQGRPRGGHRWRGDRCRPRHPRGDLT